jgi:hypothetical protein
MVSTMAHDVFDTFVLWPTGDDPATQIERFAAEVIPAVREAAARA